MAAIEALLDAGAANLNPDPNPNPDPDPNPDPNPNHGLLLGPEPHAGPLGDAEPELPVDLAAFEEVRRLEQVAAG